MALTFIVLAASMAVQALSWGSFNPINLVPGPVKQGAQQVVKPVQQVVQQVVKPVEQVAQQVVKPVEQVAQQVVKPVEQVAQQVVKPVEQVPQQFVKPVEQVAQQVVKPVEQVDGTIKLPANLDLTNPSDWIRDLEKLPDRLLEIIGNIDPTNPRGWIREKGFDQHVHGKYCGPNWCSNQEIPENKCPFTEEPRDCADRCCYFHDQCCGSVGTYGDCTRSGCDDDMVECQRKCVSQCGKDEACLITAVGLAEFFKVKQPATCCGHTLDATALQLNFQIALSSRVGKKAGLDQLGLSAATGKQVGAPLQATTLKAGLKIDWLRMFGLVLLSLGLCYLGYHCKSKQTKRDSFVREEELSEWLLKDEKSSVRL